jgi:hypothetical protein
MAQVGLDCHDLDLLIGFWSRALGYELEQRDAAVERALALGARRLWRMDFTTHYWTVLADPEGNEFCVGKFGEG